MNEATSDSALLQEDLVEDLRAQRPTHPALIRVHNRLVDAQSMPIHLQPHASPAQPVLNSSVGTELEQAAAVPAGRG